MWTLMISFQGNLTGTAEHSGPLLTGQEQRRDGHARHHRGRNCLGLGPPAPCEFLHEEFMPLGLRDQQQLAPAKLGEPPALSTGRVIRGWRKRQTQSVSGKPNLELG